MASFDTLEQRLLANAAQDLGALSVAGLATAALADVLNGASVPPADDDAPPSYYVKSALLLLAIMGIRTARAAMLVVAAGYEPEAHGLKRRLSEIHARAQAVSDDASGQHARDWLDGKGPSTPRKVVGKWGSLDIWDVYSASEHADVKGVHWWLMVPIPDADPAHHGLIVQPHRRPAFSNAMLTEVAMECRDLAAALAASRGGGIQRLSGLDDSIEEAIAAYFVEEAAQDAPNE